MITILAPLFEWMQGADHPNPDAFRSRNDRAMSYLAAGRPAKAIPLYRRTLGECERELGAYHPYTMRSRNNLAMSYRAAGRTAEAIPLLERTLADCERVLGADHPDTRAARENLALLTGGAGKAQAHLGARQPARRAWNSGSSSMPARSDVLPSQVAAVGRVVP